MKKSILLLALACFTSLTFAQTAERVMSPKKNIPENIAKNKDLSSLNDGLTKTAMGKRLEAKGQITFFAITNDGFNKTLHGGTPKMMSEEYLPMLNKILNFHAIEGELSYHDLQSRVEMGKGVAMLKTINGESIKVILENGKIVLIDPLGNRATIIESDIKQSNGIVHIIDTLLLPQGI